MMRSIFANTAWAIAAALLATQEAHAKASAETTQGYERAWNTAVRYVRVDQNLKVTEKDFEAGYVAFEYVSAESGKSISPGALELVKLDGGKVRISVQLSKMPRYHEDVFLQGITKKIREDYGDTPPPAAPVAPSKSPPSPAPAKPERRGSDDL